MKALQTLRFALRGVVFFTAIFITIAWFNPLRADDDPPDYVPDQVVVKLDPASGATIAAVHATYGTSTLETLLGSSHIYLLQIAPQKEVEEAVAEMLSDPRLLYVEPNFVDKMPEGDPSGTWAWGGHDPQPYLDQYATEMLNLAAAHTVTQGVGAVVAVLDTGVQLNHPRLAGRLTSARYDFIEDDTIPSDASNGIDDDQDGLTDEGAGHGTHVAGTVNLIAPEARIMPLRVLDSDGGGNDFLLAEAIQYAAANGADVMNLSLGTSRQSALLQDVIGAAIADGIVVVAAAGNLNNSVEQYPAAHESVLAVTSVGPSAVKSPFASYGSWVDIATPGEGITSTFPIDGYARWSGTSMATSFVSGQAALIRSEFPSLPVAAVSALIQSTAQPLEDTGYPLGAGVADIGASLGVFPVVNLNCGQMLVRSVRLANDLLNCPGDGLVIAANRITIDLNGHTLDGVGLGAGVRNDGFDGVTITNGTMQEFDFGVQLNAGTTGNVVSALTLQLNQNAGILLSGAGDGPNGNTVRNNTLINNDIGILLLSEEGSLVQDNTMSGNAEYAIHLLNANHNVLEANTLNGSSDIAFLLEGANNNTLIGNTITASADGAIVLMAASNDNRVEENSVIDSSDSGISVIDSNGNDLLFNTIQDGSDNGIALINAHDNVVEGNDVRFNATGIELSAATGNVIESNDASHSSGIGIEVQAESLGNVIILNVSSFNAAEGILIEAEILPESTDPGNLLDRNRANDNQSKGILVSKPGHTLTANVADNNNSWGIYADVGTIDGGGNIATGNLELLQCFNLICSDGSPPPDTTPPQTTIHSGPAATTTATSATFTFSADESGMTFECSLDTAPFSTCVSPRQFTGLNVGTHTFAVRARDAAANTDPTPATYTWTVSENCGSITVFASADAWISQGSAAANMGTDPLIKVQAKGKSAFRALVRFSLPAAPEGCVIQSAALRLYAGSWANKRTLQAIRINAAWTENSVTWSNQPATIGAAVTTKSGSGYRQWNVTSQVRTMVSTGTNHGFLIRDAKEGGKIVKGQQFHSREAAQNTPMLVITFAPTGG